MNVIKNNKGIVLAMVMAFLALFVIGTTLYLTLTTTDFAMSKRSTYASKAFFLAESGVNKALYELRKDFNWPGENLPINYGFADKGEYSVSVANGPGNTKIVTSTGYFLNATGPQAFASKTIEAGVAGASTPAWFYGNAVTAGNDIRLVGNSFITGNVKYGEDGSIDPANYPNSSSFTEDFPMLDFVYLKTISELQIKPNGENNLYTEADINAGKDFPTSFWFSEEGSDGIDNDGDGLIDGADPDEVNIPNVVYVETDLTLRGNVGTLCGFFVVAGDVITNPSVDSVDTTINGNGTIDGCVYTYGNFRINGGGNGLGIQGGVWAKDDVRLNGHAQVVFNQTYMDAIGAMNIGVKPQIIYWKEAN